MRMIRHGLIHSIAVLILWATVVPAQIVAVRPDGGTGDLPIVECRTGSDAGCIELLINALPGQDLAALTPCWTLPPFGHAGVEVSAPILMPSGPNSRTWRMRLEFSPLSALPAGEAQLAYGLAQPDGTLSCALVLAVRRASSQIDLPASLDLGNLQVEPWGTWQWTPLITPMAPVAGQPPVGPLTFGDTVQLTAPGREGGRVQVAVSQSGPAMLAALATGSLTLSHRAGGGRWPPLGALSGTLVVNAPQLTSPRVVTVTAQARIGLMSIFVLLAFGIGAGWYIRHNLLTRQGLAGARLSAQEAIETIEARLANEGEPTLIAAIGDQIADLHALVVDGAKAEIIVTRTATLKTDTEARLVAADTARATMAQRIAPLLRALAALPEGQEFPTAEIAAWKSSLDQVATGLGARKVNEPQALLDGAAMDAERAAVEALADLAAHATTGLSALSRWHDPAAMAALAPLAALLPQFAAPDPAQPADGYLRLRGAMRNLLRVAVSRQPQLDDYLRGLTSGAAAKGVVDAQLQTDAVLAAMADHPLQSLDGLDALNADYEAAARTARLTPPFAFENVFAPLVEAGAVLRDRLHTAPPEAGPPAMPETALTALRLVVSPPMPMVMRAFEVHVQGLAAGEIATIETPVGATRLANEGPSEVARFRLDRPGEISINVHLAGGDGTRVGTRSFDVTVRPSPTHTSVAALRADAQAVDREAQFAAAALAALSGLALFQTVPLTNWWALLAPLLWGFFVNLNLAEAIERLRGQNTKALQGLGISP